MILYRSLPTSLARGHHPRLRLTLGRYRPISSHCRSDIDPLSCYTSGRWLWNEREQLAARYRHFDMPNLKHIACKALGTEQCTSFEKIGEGNYNKAYRLAMDNGQKVIAKVPHPNAGTQVLTTSSEVATMEFVRTVLNIPVPMVLAWSATDQNPVQAEYIIMDEARGSPLHEVWEDLPLRSKCDVVREFVDLERKLLSVSFNKYALHAEDPIDSAYPDWQIGVVVSQRFWYCGMRTCHCHRLSARCRRSCQIALRHRPHHSERVLER